MTLDEFETNLEAIIGRPSFLRPFVCDGSPLDCDILLVGFNPKTPMPADYWSFWKKGQGFEKAAFEQAYSAKRLADGESEASNTREVMRRFAKGAAGCRIVEANLYSKDSRSERELAKSDRDLRPFRFLLSAIQPRVVVPFGRFATREFASIEAKCPVEPVKHFSRGWGHDNAEAFGARLAELCRQPSDLKITSPLITNRSQETEMAITPITNISNRMSFSAVDDGDALREAAFGLAQILDDNPILFHKTEKTRVSIWLPAEPQPLRLFRLSRTSKKPDLLIRIDLVNRSPQLQRALGHSTYKPNFFRFLDDNSAKTREIMVHASEAVRLLLGGVSGVRIDGRK